MSAVSAILSLLTLIEQGPSLDGERDGERERERERERGRERGGREGGRNKILNTRRHSQRR